MIFSRDVRGLLLFTLVLGMLGTAAELFLLQHYEDPWQVAPLVLIAAALVVLALHGVSGSRATVRGIQALMALFIVSGVIGAGLHYKANGEFEREMNPALAGFELFRESLSGATPALAPGTMIQLGLIGLAYTYRHPRLDESMETASRRQE
jgi:hypothetical protein